MKWMFYFILLTGYLHTLTVSGQHIDILNASFEGEPADTNVPQGWMACKEGTTPDILPGVWGVYTDPSEGNTYLGLITRQNNTWECIGHRLSPPLLKGSCYALALQLAHADTYSGNNGAIKLRVWITKTKSQ